MTPFDIINDLSTKKTDLIRSSENPELVEKTVFNQWLTNKHFSLFIDSIMYANEANMYSHLDNLLISDLYKYSLRSKKRISKWPKKASDGDIEVVSQFYNISLRKAEEYYTLLSPEQIEVIKNQMETGGQKNDKNKRSAGNSTNE
jgi:hypothetical protein